MPKITAVYCDESGFTGNNLLDRSQPFFSYAAVVADSVEVSRFVASLIEEYKFQGGELKGSRLLQFNRGRQAVERILLEYASVSKVAIHDKRFALATYFFEYIFEPALAERNSIFYRANFHRFIAALVYAHLIVGNKPAETLISEFFEMMRNLDSSKLKIWKPTPLHEFQIPTALDQIALFAHLNKASINNEINVIYGDGSLPNWILDLSTTSLFNILSELSTIHPTMQVWCDHSKPLLANSKVFDHMINRPEFPFSAPHSPDSPFGFNLAGPPSFADSREVPGIQIADVIACAANFIFRNPTDRQAQKWREIMFKSLSNANIMPDLEYADLNTENGFVGAIILNELVDRSIKAVSLFNGMPELIESARFHYPEWTLANLASEQKKKVK